MAQGTSCIVKETTTTSVALARTTGDPPKVKMKVTLRMELGTTKGNTATILRTSPSAPSPCMERQVTRMFKMRMVVTV